MKSVKKIRELGLKILIIFICVFMCAPVNIFAAGTSFSLSGSDSVNTNTDFSLQFLISSTEGLNSAEGVISVADPSCVELVKIEKMDSGVKVNNTNMKFVFFTLEDEGIPKSGALPVVKVYLKSKGNACTTSVNATNIEAGFTVNSLSLQGQSTSKTIKVVNNTPAPVTKSDDATLKSLSSSNGTISPTFNKDNKNYTMSVPNDTGEVTFNAIPNNEKATITNGKTCKLTSATTACKITVKAEDGKTLDYVVNVSKKGTSTPENPKPSNPSPSPSLADATLKSLNMDGYTLKPTFKKDVTNYAITVNNNITGLKVTALPTDPNAKVEIAGNKNWKEGVNTVRITVTATDGSEKIYIVNVTRKPSSNTTTSKTSKSSDNYLKSLSINNSEISPKFDKNTSNYSVKVSNDVNKLDLSAIANNSKSKVKVIGNENLKTGVNVVTLEVTAEDGSIRVYTINVTKSEETSNNKLSNLVIKDYPINFDKNVFEYDITVPSDVNELDVSGLTNNKNAKVEVTGNKNLKEGNNTVLVKVTDENGFTQYYKVNVNKEPKKKGFLGFTLGQWLMLLGLLLLTLLFVLFLLILFKKKKDEEKKPEVAPKDSNTPIINFKPEFNFGSKNGTDDDVVAPGGVLNQYAGVPIPPKEEPKQIVEAKYDDAEVARFEEKEEIPYDIYDDNVTKDELYDAIEESLEKKDVKKLKILYAQEKLNREKEKLRQSEGDK